MATFTQKCNVSFDGMKGKKHQINLTVDGDLGELLEKCNSAIITYAVFYWHKIKSQGLVRTKKEKNPNMTVKELQDFAETLRPVLGTSVDPIKKKERDKADLRRVAPTMSDEELKKEGLQRIAQ